MCRRPVPSSLRGNDRSCRPRITRPSAADGRSCASPYFWRLCGSVGVPAWGSRPRNRPVGAAEALARRGCIRVAWSSCAPQSSRRSAFAERTSGTGSSASPGTSGVNSARVALARRQRTRRERHRRHRRSHRTSLRRWACRQGHRSRYSGRGSRPGLSTACRRCR